MDNLRILIVGGGGREHALCWKIAASPLVSKVYCAPGNGGTESEAKVENLPIAVDQFDQLARFSSDNNIDLVVVGPDNPLADGIVDVLEKTGLKVFGPLKESARLESSKSYAKDVMTRAGIPTAPYSVFTDKESALRFARDNDWAKIVKADGLAFGKGVKVCDDIEEVEAALSAMFDEKAFGDAADRVILEKRLYGEELSLFLLCDGKTVLPLAPSQDHKRRFAGDRGPNTGGMGAYSPVPLYDDYKGVIDEQVLRPLEQALSDGIIEYKGVLFIGILIEEGNPFVLEFNARFGDPEAQAILPRLKSDLVPALMACTSGTLAQIELDWDPAYSLCVVVSADTYPEKSSKGVAIEISSPGVSTTVFHAGTKMENGNLVTAGGRILAVTGLGDSIDDAARHAYEGVRSIKFDGMDYRKDIAGGVREKCH